MLSYQLRSKSDTVVRHGRVPGMLPRPSREVLQHMSTSTPHLADDGHAQAPLRLSDDHRSLVDATGEPFFFLGDTAWSVVWKGRPEQWVRYLDRRQAQGYSVLQVNLLPWRASYVDIDDN